MIWVIAIILMYVCWNLNSDIESNQDRLYELQEDLAELRKQIRDLK